MTDKAIDGLKSDDELWNSIQWNKVNQIVNCLQTRIVKAVTVNNVYCRVLNCTFSMLEPCEVKVSRRVLRGGRDRKVLPLPDVHKPVIVMFSQYGPKANLPWKGR